MPKWLSSTIFIISLFFILLSIYQVIMGLKVIDYENGFKVEEDGSKRILKNRHYICVEQEIWKINS